MCGRFTYRFTWSQLQTLMELLDWPSVELTPRFNVAPTQLAPVVREISGGGGGATRRTGVMLRWGLVPRWAAGGAGGEAAPSTRLINARAETVATKPAFREAFARRRCLVPISGFYEWKTLSDGKSKQPYWVSRSDGQPFALAGLWEIPLPASGPVPAAAISSPVAAPVPDDPIATFTLITTTPNALMAPIHDRMPVIVSPQDYARWLDPSVTSPAAVESLLKPCDPKGYESRAVGRSVSNPGLDHPGLLDPVEAMDRPAGYLF